MSAFHHTHRWAALRLQAKRRDGFKCTECGSKLSLEVHHVKPVEQYPELAFDLANLTTMCAACHLAHTLADRGVDPERMKWRRAVKALCNSN